MVYIRELPTDGKCELTPQQNSEFEAMLKRGAAKQLYKEGLLTDMQLERIISRINSRITCIAAENAKR